jgi:hypothetical protein
MSDLESRLDALEAEVHRLRAHQEISRLIASYGPRVDSADNLERSAQLAQMWTEDGIYDIGGVGPKYGRAAIAEAFAEHHFAMVPNGVCHVMGLPFIQVDGERATALNYSCVFRPDGERFYAWRVSANHWSFEYGAEGWRVARRVNRLMRGGEDIQVLLRDIDRMLAQGDRP